MYWLSEAHKDLISELHIGAGKRDRFLSQAGCHSAIRHAYPHLWHRCPGITQTSFPLALHFGHFLPCIPGIVVEYRWEKS
jgi:hypothetical protein